MLWLGPRPKRTAAGLLTRSRRGRPGAVWRHGDHEADLPGHGSVSYGRLRVRFVAGGNVRKRQWYFNDSDEQLDPVLKSVVKFDLAMVSIDDGPWLATFEGPRAREVVDELIDNGVEEYRHDDQETG